MEWTRRQGRIVASAILATIAVLVLARISAFGIWDPWELSAADLARQIGAGEAGELTRPPLTSWLIASGFSLFGIHEWSGRLPVALAGLAAVALAYALVARFAGRRAGVWTAIAAGTTPLFLLNARQMLGAAPAFAASAAVFLCAMALVFTPAPLGRPSALARVVDRTLSSLPPSARPRVLWLLGLALSGALAVLASGALLGLAPPLLAAAIAVLVRGELRAPYGDRFRAGAAWLVFGLGVGVAAGAARAVWADYASFGYWTGGVPRGGNPPSWEVAIEALFHSFAPWSALLPVALGKMLVGAPRPERVPGGDRRLAPFESAPRVDHPEEDALRLGLVAWVALGFVAQTLYAARFGPATFLPLVGAAAAVGLLLRDVERAPRGHWAIAVVAFLFVGLLVRDFRGYPNAPLAGLAVEGLEVPDEAESVLASVVNGAIGVFGSNRQLDAAGWLATNPWILVLALFGLIIALGLAADPSAPFASLRRELGAIRERPLSSKGLLGVARIAIPIELIGTQWRRGVWFKVWLIAGALLLATIAVFGLVCWVAPSAIDNSLVVRVGKVLALVPLALAGLIAAARLGLFGFAKLGENRLVPALVAAVVVGAYTSLVFQPELSSHFSPREVYDTYNELAQPGEPLGEFRVGGRAAAYYATGEISELASQPELIRFLQQEQRVWAAFRADDLAAIDREYRREAGRHLFIADARSARMLLATNQPVAGRENQNYLADAVLDEAPTPEHRTRINFDNRIELIGYDLGLPNGSSVGPGQSFTITWFFRVIAPVPGGYQPFVHIDGPGQRINGDHEPVDGRYPVRLWEAGDIIRDRHELRVPPNYRSGDLVIYMGFYSGEQRLEVVEGPEDDVNRARVGTLPIR